MDGDFRSRLTVMEEAADAYRQRPSNSPEGIAAIMMSGMADGYQMALTDIARWLRMTNRNTAAIDLEKACERISSAQSKKAPPSRS